MNNPQLSVLP